ncbi:hypothetical protein J4E08_23405 [Sagittula sp. NFXS13]|uniref:hypothetical protein n=1 Tax=Sagittula sp. NFXS13 TaxID=2819095 RepID=UPI0032DF98A8
MGILYYDGAGTPLDGEGNQVPFARNVNRALDALGNPVPHAKRYVYIHETETLAALFEDSDLTLTVANPMSSDSEGNFSPCSVIEGIYTVVITDEIDNVLTRIESVAIKGGADVGAARGFRQLSNLLSNETLSYSTSYWRDRAVENEILDIAETGQRYSIASADSTTFDYQTAGGVKLIDLSRRSERSAAAAASNPDGTIVVMDGLSYAVDHAAIGSESATGDLGIDGLRPFGRVRPAHYGDELHRAIANSTSGEIHLPVETITVDHLHLRENVSILGQGRKRTIIKVTGYTNYDGLNACIVASGDDDSGLTSQMRINGVEIDATAVTTPGVNGLLVMRKLSMNEVHVHHATSHGIVLRSGLPNQQAVYFADFQNVWAKSNGGSGMRITDNSNANKFELCQFDSNGEHGVHQLLVGKSGVNQAVYNNLFVCGQASYNQMNGIYVQNGANMQLFGTYMEYNSQIDGGNPKVGAFKNLNLGPTASRIYAVLGEQGTDTDLEQGIGMNSQLHNFVSVGGHQLTPNNDLSLGYVNSGSGRKIKMNGFGGCEHALEFHEGTAGATARLRYNGAPSSPGNEVRMEVTADNGNTWKTLWHGRNDGKLSVYGEAPVDQGSLLNAATDLNSAIALVNNLRTVIRNYGIAR